MPSRSLERLAAPRRKGGLISEDEQEQGKQLGAETVGQEGGMR
jgi:hypothetical protein